MDLPCGYNVGKQGLLAWNPIPNIYCPPVLQSGICCIKMRILDQHLFAIGLIIGKEGHHFKKITHQSMCLYIYFLKQTSEIEIWGHESVVYYALELLCNHINKVLYGYPILIDYE
jgi:hypothetical protein